MKILVAGGTGFIGNMLLPCLLKAGHQVSMLVPAKRKHTVISSSVAVVEGEAFNPLVWRGLIEKHQVIINLAGSTIFRRWNKAVKDEIYTSRIHITRNIVDAFKSCPADDRHFFCASGVGYYGYPVNELLTEESRPGSSFLARVAVDWEGEALKARECGVRVVLCRFGIVLGKNGGAFKNMLPFFRYGLGGRWGDGRQWFSWIHALDCSKAILFLLEKSTVEGAVNLTAPNPVTNRELTYLLRRRLRRRTLFPIIPGFLMRAFLGEFADVFLKGQRVMPQKLLAGGFQFRHPALEGCISDLLDERTPPAM
jgi:hypothetical protein